MDPGHSIDFDLYKNEGFPGQWLYFQDYYFFNLLLLFYFINLSIIYYFLFFLLSDQVNKIQLKGSFIWSAINYKQQRMHVRDNMVNILFDLSLLLFKSKINNNDNCVSWPLDLLLESVRNSYSGQQCVVWILHYKIVT